MLYFKDKRYAFELKKFIDNTARVVSNDQHSCEQYCHDDFQTDASFYRDQQTDFSCQQKSAVSTVALDSDDGSETWFQRKTLNRTRL